MPRSESEVPAGIEQRLVRVRAASERRGRRYRAARDPVPRIPGTLVQLAASKPPALAAAGDRAVAIDQRGYGRSDRPVDPALYDANFVMNDVLQVIDALGERQAVLVGHDFGAQQVCNLAVRHPGRVRAVVIMSCPYDFDLAGRGGRGRSTGTDERGGCDRSQAERGLRPGSEGPLLPHELFPVDRPAGAGTRRRPGEFLARLFWALSGDGGYTGYASYPPHGTGDPDVLPPAPPLPWRWMTVADMDYYVCESTRTGRRRHSSAG